MSTDNGTQTTPLEVTPAAEWKLSSQRGFVVTLPSMRSIRMIRTMDLVTMLRLGQVPNPLADHLRKQLEGPVKSALEGIQPQVLEQLTVFMEETVCKTVTYPKFVMVPEGENRDVWQPEGEDEVSIADMSWEDKGFVFQVVQGGTTDLIRFREQQASVMATVEDVAGVAQAPKSDSGPAPNRATRRATAKQPTKQPAKRATARKK